ncbi:PadR family transcriptional regulator [Bacillus sp. AFS001701]|uniref:PadR family transcriptional regulator n=1 Tax=Bacillus sp. AFS001701 TaxID=2033480 RepID=UPI000BF47ED5|nr:PadR family transcriptional regulator [Bacillus sp. AFS001701]PET36115.1 PadR family transcriptional regulator [Bacillus sp. AFS001701]
MEKDKWIIQLRKGVFELAVLSLINQKPMYGYEITNHLKGNAVFEIPNGSIYPILNRLTKNKWAITYWEDNIDSPKRKYYQITYEGILVLNERLKDYEDVYLALKSLGRKDK